MRLRVTALAALMAAAFGCKPPPISQVEPGFRAAVRRHFTNLNKEAQLGREEFRRGLALAEQTPTILPPPGTVYSTYMFDDAAFVVGNYPCATCKARLLLTSPSTEYLCKACGHSPYKVHPPGADLKKAACSLCVSTTNVPVAPDEAAVSKAAFEKLKDLDKTIEVNDMFFLTQSDTKLPLEADVRYVRTAWSYDGKATVSVSAAALAKGQIAADAASKWFPTAGVRDEIDATGSLRREYNAQGFHRLVAVYVGMVRFQYKGGELIALGDAREEPVRPWKDLKR